MNRVFIELKLAVEKYQGQHDDLFFYRDYSCKVIQEDMNNRFIALKKDKWSEYCIQTKWRYFNVFGLDSDGKTLP